MIILDRQFHIKQQILIKNSKRFQVFLKIYIIHYGILD